MGLLLSLGHGYMPSLHLALEYGGACRAYILRLTMEMCWAYILRLTMEVCWAYILRLAMDLNISLANGSLRPRLVFP
jgi:hypothetical protein